MKFCKIILSLLLLLISLNLFAQSEPRAEDRFFYGSQVDEDLQAVTPDYSYSTKGIQYGGIFTPVFLYEARGDDKLNSAMLNLKLWGKTYLWNNSYLYVSVKDSYLSVLSGEGVYEDIDSENVLDLDQGFISMTAGNGIFKFSAGRKYFNIGTGVVLDGRGDGAEAELTGSVFSLKLLGLYTGLMLKDNNPYGLSDKDLTDGAERVFSGGTLSMAFSNQEFYLFGLVQMDRSKEETTQYDSQYYGAGLEGVVFNDVSYYAEGIFETGDSYINSNSGNETSKIAAYAFNSGINYFIPVKLNPALIFQYAYGSGDKYRQDYTNGNRPEGATGYDKGFISFGTFSGGYALKPVLSNIHIIRFGFTMTPFSTMGNPLIEKLSLGAKYSYYMKDYEKSPINSNEGANPEAFIGHGLDVSVRWQIYYDLSMYLNYGLFMPGDAYESSASNENFVMLGMNLSF